MVFVGAVSGGALQIDADGDGAADCTLTLTNAHMIDTATHLIL